MSAAAVVQQHEHTQRRCDDHGGRVRPARQRVCPLDGVTRRARPDPVEGRGEARILGDESALDLVQRLTLPVTEHDEPPPTARSTRHRANPGWHRRPRADCAHALRDCRSSRYRVRLIPSCLVHAPAGTAAVGQLGPPDLPTPGSHATPPADRASIPLSRPRAPETGADVAGYRQAAAGLFGRLQPVLPTPAPVRVVGDELEQSPVRPE